MPRDYSLISDADVDKQISSATTMHLSCICVSEFAQKVELAPLRCRILRAWTSGPLRAVTTTSMSTLSCVPDRAFLLIEAVLNSLSVC